MTGFALFHRAAELPAGWDTASDSQPFLQRSFLQLVEQCHPAAQRYYYLESNQTPSLFVSYRHRLNILTYGRGVLTMALTMVGVPCSVASPGFLVQPDHLPHFTRALAAIPGGLVLLNSEFLDLAPLCARSLTLPSCVLMTEGRSFAHYLRRMRSHYRYKVLRSLDRFSGVQAIPLSDNSDFSQSYYQLYQQVFRRSQYKLEQLPLEFFRSGDSEITLFANKGQPLGFCQTKIHNHRLFFLFGGMDYQHSHRFHTYCNILLYIIKKGLANKVEAIDLGQTAEEVKLRLGCMAVPKYLFARHANPLINLAVHKGIGLLGYNRSLPSFRVFREKRA